MEPGIGVDCIYLVKGILNDLGIGIDIPPYPKDWRYIDPILFERHVSCFSYRIKLIDRNQIQFGDVVLLKDADGYVKHAGIVTDLSHFIHVLDDDLGTVRIDFIENYALQIQRFVRVSE